MALPQHDGKFDSPAVLTPEAHLSHRFGDDLPAVPDGLILTFQDDLFSFIAREEGATTVDPDSAAYTLTWLEDTDQRVGAVGEFGIGAPVAAALVEEFATLGTEVFCILGGAGTLQPDVTGRDALVVEAAIRDEGTSHHYLEPDRTVDADDKLTELLAREAAGLAETVHRGPTWTTDAIFRETEAEIRDYSEAGVLAVEMEAAAVFAVATYRNLHAGALLVAFDSLAESEWDARVDDTERRLERFVPAVRDAVVDRLESR